MVFTNYLHYRVSEERVWIATGLNKERIRESRGGYR